ASVTVPLAVDPELAWQAATKADTVEAYRGYQQRFPQSPHAAEADGKAKAMVARAAQHDFDAALAAENADAATKAFDMLRATADAPAVAAAQDRLDKLVAS